jgi:predicted anti-sigma-YlaC factor YlaD
MMDCSEIRDQFLRGDLPPEERVKEHLAGCPQCRALFERDAELGRSLAAQVSQALPFSEDFFGQIEQTLEQETGPRAWLRSRPSRLRFMLLLLPLLLLLIAGGVLWQRADFEHYPLLRVLLLLCAYGVAIVLAFGKELSESPRPAPLRDYVGLLAFALFVPALAAFAPATEASLHTPSGGVSGAFGCFAYGALFTLPIAALLWALDRNQRPSLRTACLSAAALGLSANLLLELHCSKGGPEHVLLGHASLGLAWLVTSRA